MQAMMNFFNKVWNFLQKGLTDNLSKQEIKREADKIELPFFLITHGVPKDLINSSTIDEMRVYEELIQRQMIDKVKIDSVSTQIGIVKAFGGDKSGN